jgi:hypothetical protein
MPPIPPELVKPLAPPTPPDDGENPPLDVLATPPEEEPPLPLPSGVDEFPFPPPVPDPFPSCIGGGLALLLHATTDNPHEKTSRRNVRDDDELSARFIELPVFRSTRRAPPDRTLALRSSALMERKRRHRIRVASRARKFFGKMKRVHPTGHEERRIGLRS